MKLNGGQSFPAHTVHGNIIHISIHFRKEHGAKFSQELSRLADKHGNKDPQYIDVITKLSKQVIGQ